MDLKVRKHIYFYGRVQGVGFRYYAVQKAGQLGLAGWVRNRYDGSERIESRLLKRRNSLEYRFGTRV